MAESAYFEMQKIERGMIEDSGVYRKHNNQTTFNLNLSHVSNTRGNKYKMQLAHMHCNLRTFLVIGLLRNRIVYLTLLF